VVTLPFVRELLTTVVVGFVPGKMF